MEVGVVTFLSDYGLDDEFVGVCHGVIARLAPDARVIDLGHGIAPGDVLAGALVLANALPYVPAGIHLAVVDPGVGTERRAVAIRVASEGRVLVGPDNGLLGLAVERFGGAVEAVDVGESRYRLSPVSATFHGRDVFAPVAARIATGASLADAGDEIDPDGLVRLALPAPSVTADAVETHAVHVDRFGNVTLALRAGELSATPLTLGAPLEVHATSRPHPAQVARTFADVAGGKILLYEDSYGMTALAVNGGSAAEVTGLGPGDEVVLRAIDRAQQR